MINSRQSTARSAELFTRAQTVIPGGVNSPVRAFNAVGGAPRFIKRGEGAWLWDVDDNVYLDYVMSWGPLINGHAYAPGVQAITQAAALGTTYGAPTEAEVLLAERIVAAFPSVEMVRFTSSGTEAAMSAIRLARGVTGRDLIIKFAGNYHGHADGLLAQAGSGSLTLGVPSSPGVPAGTAEGTIIARYNDVADLRAAVDRYGDRLAAILVEPIAGNMGVVVPTLDFLRSIETYARQTGALFVCDEVITGFRVGLGGAQVRFDLSPDITILGKIIGGGLPVGAYAGGTSVMSQVAPTGPIYQAGTLSGNPLAMAAGMANLEPLTDPGFYVDLERKTQLLAGGLEEAARDAGVPVTVNHCTGMLTVFFTDGPVDSLPAAEASNTPQFAQFFHAMLREGIYLPPSQFESWMLSARHDDEMIERTVSGARVAFAEVAANQ